MKNLIFILWMLGWPIGSELSSVLGAYARKLDQKPYNEDRDSVDTLATIVEFCIWIIVGALLFER